MRYYLFFLTISLAGLTGCAGNKAKPATEVTPQPAKADQEKQEAAPVATPPTAPAQSEPGATIPTDLGGIESQPNPAITSENLAVTTPPQEALTMISQRAENAPTEEAHNSAPLTQTQEMQVTAAGLNVRSEPSMRASVVRTLPRDTVVKALSREGIWVQIGENEYVSISYLKEVSAATENQSTSASK